jgi:hypothetical protein
MSRSRSPKYPSESLPSSLDRVKAIYDADQTNPVDREAAAIHMGYSGISGASDKTISNLMQYGLLERVGKGEVRVTREAVNVLYALPGMDNSDAVHKVAFNPPLFATLREQFPSVPSKETLKIYLKREGFIDSVVSRICSAYLETCAYAEQNSAYDLGFPSAPDSPESAQSQEHEDIAPMTTTTPETDSASPVVVSKAAAPARAEVFNFSNGEQAALVLPESISPDDYEDFSDWLTLMARRAKRRVIDNGPTEH